MTRRVSRPAPPAGHALGEGASRALGAWSRAFERAFAACLPDARLAPRRLHAAMRYGALSPGKRLRPLLVLAGCEAVGGDWRRALPAAVAVECVHAFSLIHDDLPAMDDDDFRRGRPTTHRRHGEALALLAGDALLALAFEQLAGLEERGLPAKRVVRALRVLARASGSRELVGGQALDLAAEGRRANGAAVRDIHLRKTGALISASLMLGGFAGGARPTTLAALERMGRDLGLAFQIHDDLLNRRSSLRRLGKRTGTDDARKKATFPRAVGEERARAEAAHLYLRALRRVERLGPRAYNLGHLIIAVAERQS